jgi:hypothetical protein
MTITHLEELACLRLTDLKQQGYFSDQRGGQLVLRPGEWLTSSVRLTVWLAEDEEDKPDDPNRGSVELRYEYRGQACYQSVDLVRRPSNLGCGGGIWYFLCPLRRERCRVMYLGADGFCSPQAVEQARYTSQVLTKRKRKFARSLRRLQLIETYHRLGRDWLWRPGSKRSYRGKLTRPMQRFLKLQAIVAAHSE